MSTRAGGVALVGATITTGLSAGAFEVFGHTIMPGLKSTDDRTFVAAFQSIDRAIINPRFLGGTFFGALALTAAAAIANRRERHRAHIAGALVLYLAAVIITMRVNVPLNNAIKTAGDPDRIDLTAVREAFDETRWARWNTVRSAAATSAFGLLAWALVQHDRTTD
ncbi:anthrone oxygenase family protein [Pseudonocardia sp. TRM90224]|uniref:anthrone oxygenase family protein n=1 Tax=Pseudonocardia sp. TRM90224 TaxID=2812678 RepID=UPI001E2E0969|nr:anthrone oxygenase family protein [Pseudonocardia sp. TRM90224]